MRYSALLALPLLAALGMPRADAARPAMLALPTAWGQSSVAHMRATANEKAFWRSGRRRASLPEGLVVAYYQGYRDQRGPLRRAQERWGSRVPPGPERCRDLR